MKKFQFQAIWLIEKFSRFPEYPMKAKFSLGKNTKALFNQSNHRGMQSPSTNLKAESLCHYDEKFQA